MARPRKKIDKKVFEGLCAIQCTKAEICSAFDVTDKTLDGWVARNYQDDDGNPLSFSEVFSRKRGKGKISLRRSQFKLAERDARIAIWLGKQYLDQREPTQEPERDEIADDHFLDALREEAGKVW